MSFRVKVTKTIELDGRVSDIGIPMSNAAPGLYLNEDNELVVITAASAYYLNGKPAVTSKDVAGPDGWETYYIVAYPVFLTEDD